MECIIYEKGKLQLNGTPTAQSKAPLR